MSYQTVPCPACGEECRLLPLKRHGCYRLAQMRSRFPHSELCPGLEPAKDGYGAAYRRRPDNGAPPSHRDPAIRAFVTEQYRLEAVEQRRIAALAGRVSA